MRPFPEFESLNGDSPPFASSIYHALQVRVEKSYSGGLQFLATCTWSKSIDDVSSTDDIVHCRVKWEANESRGSRTVLEGPLGEPGGYLTTAGPATAGPFRVFSCLYSCGIEAVKNPGDANN